MVGVGEREIAQLHSQIISFMLDIKINKVDLIGSKILTNMVVLVRVGQQLQWSPTHHGTISAQFQCPFTFQLTSSCYSILIYHNPQLNDSMMCQSTFEHDKLSFLGSIQAEPFPMKLKHVKRSVYAKGNPKFCKNPLVEYELTMSVKALGMVREVVAREELEKKRREEQEEQRRKLEERKRQQEERERAEKVRQNIALERQFKMSKQQQEEIDEDKVVFKVESKKRQIILIEEKPQESIPEEIQPGLQNNSNIKIEENVTSQVQQNEEYKQEMHASQKPKQSIVQKHSEQKQQKVSPIKQFLRATESAHIDTRISHIKHIEAIRGYATSKHTNRYDQSDQIAGPESPSKLNDGDDMGFIKSLVNVNRKKALLRSRKATTKSRLFATQSESFDEAAEGNALKTEPSQIVTQHPKLMGRQTMRSQLSQTSRKLENVNLQSTFSRTPRPDTNQQSSFSPSKNRKISFQMNLKTIEPVVEEEDDATDKHQRKSRCSRFNIAAPLIQHASKSGSPRKSREIQVQRQRKYTQVQKYIEASENYSGQSVEDKNSVEFLIFNTIIFQNFDKISPTNPTFLQIRHQNTQITTQCICQKSILFTKQAIPLKKLRSELLIVSVYEIIQGKNILFGKSQIQLLQLRKNQYSRTIKLDVLICNVKVGELIINHEFSTNKQGNSMTTIRKRQSSLTQETINRRSSDSVRRKSTISSKLKNLGVGSSVLPSIYQKN